MASRTLREHLMFWVYIFKAWMVVIYRLFVPLPLKSVKGQVVLVTGGGRGIGRAIALKFSQHGAKLVLWDILKENLEDTTNEITALGGFAKSYICDVTKYDDVKMVAEQVRQEVGDVDILVNNAGVMCVDEFLCQDVKSIRRTMEVNIMSHFWTVKEFLPSMYERNSGHLVSIASSAGLFGTPLLADYCASKFAVVGFTESLSEEMRRYKKTGIHTTTVCPLMVNTNLLDQDSKITYINGERNNEAINVDVVASKIVEGTLRNNRMVYLPGDIGFANALRRTLPWSVMNLMLDVKGVGFYKKQD